MGVEQAIPLTPAGFTLTKPGRRIRWELQLDNHCKLVGVSIISNFASYAVDDRIDWSTLQALTEQ